MGPDPLPMLPMLLWETPPGLEQVLQQEGIPHVRVREGHPLAFHAGRFVLFDRRNTSRATLRRWLTEDHVAIDIDALREGEPSDPFAQLIRHDAGPAVWRVGPHRLIETVHRVPRAALRLRLLGRLRSTITRHGGLWARLAAFPYPYRSAFNLRVDLDEPIPEDYARFAKSRRPLADCTTHFVSTSAYGDQAEILDDLRQFDTQSHGHYHHVYRDADANRQNLGRAHEVLRAAGLTPTGYAAPHGRWNAGLNRVLEELGYLYSSEFQIAYDDLPFFPWCEGRRSGVLQVPIHPVCEGLFFEAGLTYPRPVADYLTLVVRAKIEAGEPAFIYGHPERRLARYPEILAAVASAVAGESFLGRVGLTEFARWWRWRVERRWSVLPRGPGLFEVQFDDWDGAYPLGLEIRRGEHVAALPIRLPRETIRLDALAYERRRLRADLPRPTPGRPSRSLRSMIRKALDWELVTPIEDLPATTLSALLKRQLRTWRGRRDGP